MAIHDVSSSAPVCVLIIQLICALCKSIVKLEQDRIFTMWNMLIGLLPEGTDEIYALFILMTPSDINRRAVTMLGAKVHKTDPELDKTEAWVNVSRRCPSLLAFE